MSICIPAATNDGVEASVHGHFGSAPYFVIHDSQSGTSEIIENANAHQAHGACQPLSAFEGRNVNAIVVGGIGARAIQRLNAEGVTVYRAEEGTVASNIEKLQSGSLDEITPAGGCSGHHGSGHDCG